MTRTGKTKATKLYVGRTFSLKKAQIHTGEFGYIHGNDLGHVLVLDENQKKVVVWTGWKGGTKMRLAKFYLHTEIKEEIEGNVVGELGKIAAEAAALATYLRMYHPTASTGIKRLEKLTRRVRSVQGAVEEGEAK